MYNDFVIVGPPNDPAGIKGMKSATETLQNISEKAQPSSAGVINQELMWQRCSCGRKPA